MGSDILDQGRGPKDTQVGRARVQAEWARLLLTSLADVGVRHVVLSPGSRSTPFVLAACAEPRLRLHDVVDERSAAFFALGMGRLSSVPAVLLCTSGTAAAHYLPAVIEAGMSRIPLLVLSADRPPELVGNGANQTIDQLKLFGDHARSFVNLGLADDHPAALRGLRRTAAQAVAACCWPEPGAVHLNAPARKPLEPSSSPEAAADEPVARYPAPTPRVSLPSRQPDPAALARLARACSETPRGLIVAGPGALAEGRPTSTLARQVAELCRRTGFPLLSDSTSQLRCAETELLIASGLRCDPFDLVCSAAFMPGASNSEAEQEKMDALAKAVRPRLVVQLGRAPVSAAWGRALALWAGDVEHWVLGPHGFFDAENSATEVMLTDLEPALEGLISRLGPTRPTGSSTAEPSWPEIWRRVGAAASQAVERLLAGSLAGADPDEDGLGGDGRDGNHLTEAAIARLASSAVPAGGLLAVGNSLPVRLLDVYGSTPAPGVGLLSQRGASGIDGLVSGAAGAASISGRPTLLYLGDLSLLHDLGGLASVPRTTADGSAFVILVAQNQGGRIFERLPVAGLAREGGILADRQLQHWTTPHDYDFASAASMFGLEYRQIRTVEGLRSALEEGFQTGGPWLLEAVVPPHGAARDSVAVRADLRQRLAEMSGAGHPTGGLGGAGESGVDDG